MFEVKSTSYSLRNDFLACAPQIKYNLIGPKNSVLP